MAHDHNHSHNHSPVNFGRTFAIGIVLNLAFVAIEAGYGLYAHSLALLADSGHNLSDVLSLVLAWGAMMLARRLPTAKRTYGLRRSSILVSLFNAIILLVAVGAIAWEAIGRFAHPAPTEGGVVVWVALIGIVINTATALMFMRGKENDVNIKGAFYHMAADAGVSLGVVLAGLAIIYTGWLWLDPIVSLFIAIIVVWSTWGLLKESLNLALDAVPENVDFGAVQNYLEKLPAVSGVHDLHIWPMSTTETALTAHLVIKEIHKVGDDFLDEIGHELHDKFHIEHATIQFENGDGKHPCHQAPNEVL